MRLSADIKKRIGEFDLDVKIESDSSRIGILGASGCGKSMTLRSIAGIETVDSGHIEVGGRVLFDSAAKVDLKPQKRSVGYMFQNYALFPTMTVLQNVMAGLRGPKEKNAEMARDMLDRFRMLGMESRLPGQLSGGQQQRVALARIMVTEPDLILLDEPFSALDGYLRDRMQIEMLDMLEDYKGQVVMVSHSRDELYRFSEELFVMRQGRILRHDDTKKVFSDPKRIEVAKLTGCKNFANVRMIDEHTLDVADWGVTLHLEREIPASTKHIGYRAHYFEPIWGERQENCIKCSLSRVDELPFEKSYYLRPELPGESDQDASADEHAPADEQAAAYEHAPADEHAPATEHAPADEHAAASVAANDPGKVASGNEDDKLLSWFLQGEESRIIEEKGMPDYLRLAEEHILLLEGE